MFSRVIGSKLFCFFLTFSLQEQFRLETALFFVVFFKAIVFKVIEG